MIHPYHKITCDAVKARDAFLSLHCDGNLNDVVDGVVDLGYDVVHPWLCLFGPPLGSSPGLPAPDDIRILPCYSVFDPVDGSPFRCRK